MITEQNSCSEWATTLDDFKPEYLSVKVWDTIQFYQIQGRKTILALDNFEPISDLHYCVFSPKENRYYLHDFPNIPLAKMKYYDTDEKWDSYDALLNSLRRYIEDKNLFLLLRPDQVANTSDMLRRLWKSNLKGDGKLSYQVYIKLANESLMYEDYKDRLKGTTGYLTICNQFESRIQELWLSATKSNK